MGRFGLVMKKVALILLFLITNLKAQAPIIDNDWKNYYKNNVPYSGTISVDQTSDGGYILLSSLIDDGKNCAGLKKVDHQGEVEWEITLKCNNRYPRSVQQIADGRFIVIVDNYPDGAELIKVDWNGKIYWIEKYDGDDNNDEFELESSLQQTSDDAKSPRYYKIRLIIIIGIVIGIIVLLIQKFKAWEDVIILTSVSLFFGFLYWIMEDYNFTNTYGYETMVLNFITFCHVVSTGKMVHLISKKNFSPDNATLFEIDKYVIKKIVLLLIMIYFSFLMIFIINYQINKSIYLNAASHLNDGVGYNKRDNYTEAIQSFEEAIEVKPDFAAAYYNMGITYYNKGNLTKAIQSYEKVIELDPDDAQAYYNLGLSYLDQGNYTRSIESFKKTIELDPEDAQAFYDLGLTYDNQGNYTKASKLYDKAIELDPDFASAYNNRAIIYYRKEEYDKAWNDVNKAHSLGGQVQVHPGFLEAIREASGRH